MLSTMDLKNLVLRPNCLITPSKLVFIPGPSSLFFYDKPFAWLPEFLFEHGYRTEVIRMPLRYKKARTLAFKTWLNLNSTERFHFILAESTYFEFKELIPKNSIASLTVLTTESNSEADLIEANRSVFKIEVSNISRLSTPFLYRAHQFVCRTGAAPAVHYALTFSNAKKSVYERFLDHCIKLAENELYA